MTRRLTLCAPRRGGSRVENEDMILCVYLAGLFPVAGPHDTREPDSAVSSGTVTSLPQR